MDLNLVKLACFGLTARYYCKNISGTQGVLFIFFNALVCIVKYFEFFFNLHCVPTSEVITN